VWCTMIAMIDPGSVSFAAQCPKGHMPTLVFEKLVLQKHLDRGTLELFCSLCGKSWHPGDEETRRIAGWLSRQ
jgi:hypothetical protein